MIKFINILLSFNGKKIFDDFNLEFKKGEKSLIVGDSGTGKSTLFNMLLGFVLPEKGEIIIDDIELKAKTINQIRQKIAWLPQNPSIIGKGLVIEEITNILSFEANKRNRTNNIEEEFEKLNLNKELLQSSFTELSGGEKQRIGIILAKLLDREIILLDEPTSALDEKNIDTVINYLNSMEYKTIISASHDKNLLRFCDRVINI